MAVGYLKENNAYRKEKRESQLIAELENYQPIPSDALEAKLDYFYSPYN